MWSMDLRRPVPGEPWIDQAAGQLVQARTGAQLQGRLDHLELVRLDHHLRPIGRSQSSASADTQHGPALGAGDFAPQPGVGKVGLALWHGAPQEDLSWPGSMICGCAGSC